jgi:hypothetical protein
MCMNAFGYERSSASVSTVPWKLTIAGHQQRRVSIAVHGRQQCVHHSAGVLLHLVEHGLGVGFGPGDVVQHAAALGIPHTGSITSKWKKGEWVVKTAPRVQNGKTVSMALCEMARRNTWPYIRFINIRPNGDASHNQPPTELKCAHYVAARV